MPGDSGLHGSVSAYAPESPGPQRVGRAGLAQCAVPSPVQLESVGDVIPGAFLPAQGSTSLQ